MRLWVSGYRSYELGVFKDSDPKITIIQYALKQRLQEQLDHGLTWVITGGQLGTELWVRAVVQELKQTHPDLKIALMRPFQDFGSQWQASNQQQLAQAMQQSDYTESLSQRPYESPKQLQAYQQFMVDHTDGALFVYDEEFPGRSAYDWQLLQQRASPQYAVTQITMADLQEYGTDYAERQAEVHS